MLISDIHTDPVHDAHTERAEPISCSTVVCIAILQLVLQLLGGALSDGVFDVIHLATGNKYVITSPSRAVAFYIMCTRVKHSLICTKVSQARDIYAHAEGLHFSACSVLV